jgi:sensor domain CHASE-containing protein
MNDQLIKNCALQVRFLVNERGYTVYNAVIQEATLAEIDIDDLWTAYERLK